MREGLGQRPTEGGAPLFPPDEGAELSQAGTVPHEGTAGSLLPSKAWAWTELAGNVGSLGLTLVSSCGDRGARN